MPPARSSAFGFWLNKPIRAMPSLEFFSIQTRLGIKTARALILQGLLGNLDLDHRGNLQHQTVGIDLVPERMDAEFQLLQLFRCIVGQEVTQRQVLLGILRVVTAGRRGTEIQLVQDDIAVFLLRSDFRDGDDQFRRGFVGLFLSSHWSRWVGCSIRAGLNLSRPAAVFLRRSMCGMGALPALETIACVSGTHSIG